MKIVRLYEDLSGGLYLMHGGAIAEIAEQVHDHSQNNFYSDARGLIDGEWTTGERDAELYAHVTDMDCIATMDEKGHVEIPEQPGSSGYCYLTNGTFARAHEQDREDLDKNDIQAILNSAEWFKGLDGTLRTVVKGGLHLDHPDHFFTSRF